MTWQRGRIPARISHHGPGDLVSQQPLRVERTGFRSSSSPRARSLARPEGFEYSGIVAAIVYGIVANHWAQVASATSS